MTASASTFFTLHYVTLGFTKLNYWALANQQ